MIDPKTVPAECFRPVVLTRLSSGLFDEFLRHHREMIGKLDELRQPPREGDAVSLVLKRELNEHFAAEGGGADVNVAVWRKIKVGQGRSLLKLSVPLGIEGGENADS